MSWSIIAKIVAYHEGRAMKHMLHVLLALTAIMALSAPPAATGSVARIRVQSAAAGQLVFLPAVYGQPSPAGAYNCNEYEFGLIWTTEVITLSVDGSSFYEYHGPYQTGIVTGTWVYTPTTQEVGFTNF